MKFLFYNKPTIGIGMRTLFRKNGYKVYLVDEFRSSCRCSNCNGGVCEKFRVKKHPNKDELRLIHGLLRCQNGCGLWNRDRNGASNIYKTAYQAIHKLERPTYLCRETNGGIKPPSLGLSVSRLCRETKDETSNQALKPSCHKKKSTRSATTKP
jgi:hypothetical protein